MKHKKLSDNLSASVPPSRYEMNLAEFPLTVLSTRLPADLKVIQYKDEIRGRDGEIKERLWNIKPDAVYGFGSNQLNATIFALFQIWKLQGFDSPDIRFGSIYYLAKELNLQNTQTAYERIRRDLNALVGITVEAYNAFWDNELKAYVDATFHLFDTVYFYHDGRRNQQALPFSYIKASDKLRGSVMANALTTLHLDVAHFSSYTPAEQRLALYLSKMLYAQTEHRRDVQALARQFPIYAKRYKDIKSTLTIACEGLIAKGFPHLTAYRYELKQSGRGENIIFSRATTFPRPSTRLPQRISSVSADKQAAKELLIQDLIDFSGHQQSRAFYARAVYALDSQTIYRAISETKYEHLQRRVTESKAQLLNHVLQRLAQEQGISFTGNNS